MKTNLEIFNHVVKYNKVPTPSQAPKFLPTGNNAMVMYKRLWILSALISTLVDFIISTYQICPARGDRITMTEANKDALELAFRDGVFNNSWMRVFENNAK